MSLRAKDRLKRLYWTARANILRPKLFPGSAQYWERRYSAGGDSGAGSYGKFAEFKAEVLNDFVRSRAVKSIIEHGCGDGNQLELAQYPQYLGFDVSERAIAMCRAKFAQDSAKRFKLAHDYDSERAELTLSLDVIYHLIEDRTFHAYMELLFESSDLYVIVYSSDTNRNRGYRGTHVRHRKFTDWIGDHKQEWQLVQRVPNRFPYRGDYRTGSFADFFVFQRRASSLGTGDPMNAAS